MSAVRTAAFGILLALANIGGASAQERPYFVTYDHYLEERGNLEIAAANTTRIPKNHERAYAAPWLELEMGMTGWWTAELYLEGVGDLALAVESLVRDAGRGLADELLQARPPKGSLESKVQAASTLLNEQLGALTHLESNDHLVIRGAGCPLSALTGKHPPLKSHGEETDLSAQSSGRPAQLHNKGSEPYDEPVRSATGRRARRDRSRSWRCSR